MNLIMLRRTVTASMDGLATCLLVISVPSVPTKNAVPVIMFLFFMASSMSAVSPSMSPYSSSPVK